MTSSFIQPITAFYKCLQVQLLRSWQAAMWKKPQACVKNSCLQDWTARLSIFNCNLGLNTAFTLPVYRLPSSSFPSRFLSDITRQRDWNCWLVTFRQRVHLFPIFPFSVPQPLKDYYPSPCTLFERQRHQLFAGICVKTSCNTSGFLILVVKEILGHLYVANTWTFLYGGIFCVWKKRQNMSTNPYNHLWQNNLKLEQVSLRSMPLYTWFK